MTASAVLPTVPGEWLWGHVNRVIDGIDIAPTSRVQYKREIRPFIEWLGSDSIHPNVLLAFKRHLQDRTDIGTGTKSKYLTVARVFLRELYRLHVIPIDVTGGGAIVPDDPPPQTCAYHGRGPHADLGLPLLGRC